MKKIFVLAIALLVVGLAAAPQVQAQTQADIQELQKITADFQAGKITLPEFQRRVEEIQKRSTPQTQNNQPQPQRNAPPQQPQGQGGVYSETFGRAAKGWPASSMFSKYGFTLQQPSPRTPVGLTASYEVSGDRMVIYLYKNYQTSFGDYPADPAAQGWNDSEFAEVKQHVERAFGKRLVNDFGNYWTAIGYEKNTAPRSSFTEINIQKEGSRSEWIIITVEVKMQGFD